MKKLLLFLVKFFALSIGFFLVWLVIEEYALAALAKVVLVPITIFGYRPTDVEVIGKSIRFVSAIPGRSCSCDVELAPIGFIVFLSLAFSISPVRISRRLRSTALGLIILLGFHVTYLSLRVLLYSTGGFQGPEAYLIRFFVPAGILFPVALWILLFPTNLFRFTGVTQPGLEVSLCPICGSRKDDVLVHIRDAHGKGKKGLKSRAARLYIEMFKEHARKEKG